MRRVARSPILPLIPVLVLSSCQYLQDRGMDFLDQYKTAVGVGPMGGVRVKSGGVLDTGLLVGAKPRALALGWRYSSPLFFQAADKNFDVDQAEIIKTTSMVDFNIGTGSYKSARTSAAVLPALFSWIDTTPTDYEWYVPAVSDDYNDRHWIWGGASWAGSRYAQIHAFDLELEIGLFVYMEWGFSPGEALDFWLGWFLIDIAQDDGRL